MPAQNFASLRAAVVDGRAQNVYYKQTQLEHLHKNLVKNAAAVQDAVVADSGISPAEAKIEYALALNALRNQYAQLDPKKALDDEYAVTRKQNASGLRVGAGSVLIKPANHSLVYSVIAPLVAAIAAGNCVVVQLENNLSQVPSILRKILKESLDHDAYIVAQDEVKDSKILESSIQVVQDADSNTAPTSNKIISIPSSKAIAVVDRSANFDEAAKALVNARFSFRGKSPYAPDIVFVNEFVKKDLLHALVRQTIAAGDRETLMNGALEKAKSRESGLKQLIADLQSHDDVRIVTQESTGAIVDIQRRTSDLLTRKVSEPCLIIHSMTSLDDAIDYITSQTSSQKNPLLAAYHFGNPQAAKYLSQFIPAQVSFINHIPFELLVGPAFPLNHPIDPSTRYTSTQFSKPAPAFIIPSTESADLVSAGLGASQVAKNATLKKLFDAAVADLPVLQKRPGETTVGFGFFEHSFVIHFGTLFFTTVGTAAVGIWWLRNGRSFR